jgi:hypothetical protein
MRSGNWIQKPANLEHVWARDVDNILQSCIYHCSHFGRSIAPDRLAFLHADVIYGTLLAIFSEVSWVFL